jgi:hypothetical protein
MRIRFKAPRHTPTGMAAMLAICMLSATSVQAQELEEADLFFELNNTDGDLGIHAKIDGEDWKTLKIEAPNESVLLNVTARSNLRKQGMTELAFESAEPPFDELAPNKFLARFPEGVYEIEALTLEGDELENKVRIKHILPAPPEFIFPPAAPCDDPVVVNGPVTIRWKPVTTSHPTIGKPNRPVEIERYELAVEVVDGDLTFFVELPPDITSFRVPSIFTDEPGVVKFEVLAKATAKNGGNRTAEESCFEIL